MEANTLEVNPVNSESPDFSALYKRLNSTDETVRDAAVAEARFLPTETLLALAHYETEAYRRDMKKIGRYFMPMPFVSFPLWAIGMATHHPSLMFVSFGISGWCGYKIYRRNPSNARESVAAIISTSDEPRLLGVALALMNENPNDTQIYRLVRVAVKKLLPKVPLDGSADWKEEYTSVLLKQLDFYDVELAESILKTLAVYGSARAVTAIEGMASTEPGSNERMRRARDAARSSLETLQARLAEKKVTDQLLRASDSGDKNLLRPSVNTYSQESEELLREV